jgi:hypothetical protein
MLETAGLIIQEQDPNDKRKMMIFPSSLYQLSGVKRNSEMESGVKNSDIEDIEIEEESDEITTEEIDF